MTALDSRLRTVIALATAALLCLAAVPASAQDAFPPAGSPATGDVPDPIAGESRSIAVLPLTNRSESGAPLRQIRAALMARMEQRGFNLLDEEVLATFMRRHRMRFTAGLNGEMARLLGAETGSWAALITTVDLYDQRNPPKMGMTSRLVTTEDPPRILWMDSVVRVGDQAPGGFDMGLISDLETLEDIVIRDLAAKVAGKPSASERKMLRRFRPRAHYASPEFPVVREKEARIAVLPFANDSTTRYAGEILTDQLIRHLNEVDANVVEPGIVRQVMLEARQFYKEGPSIPETDILRLHLSADVVVFGEVSTYEEKLEPRPARVEFLVRAIDAETGQLIWASSSYAGGNKGVYFFGAGQIHSAQALASEMTRALVGTVLKERAKAARKH